MRPIAGERLANMARQYISKTAADWIIQIQKITLRMVWRIATTVEPVFTSLSTCSTLTA